MQDVAFVNGLLSFIENSPTPFHAVSTMVATLESNGFKPLNESDKWVFKNKKKCNWSFLYNEK